jgi:hypothetical protein
MPGLTSGTSTGVADASSETVTGLFTGGLPENSRRADLLR